MKNWICYRYERKINENCILVNSFINKTRSILHDLKAVTFWTKFHLIELKSTIDTQTGVDL